MSYINDAGHGGTDPGAVAFGQQEKEWSLEAARYVNQRLIDHGIISTLSRTIDVTLDETPRVTRIKNSKATYCLSHHFNAGGGEGAEFIHSIYSDGNFEHMLKGEFANEGMHTRRVFCRKGKNGDYYFMHRRTGPARTTIIEYGFLDNKNDYEKLKDKEYRHKLYEAVVRAVCRRDGVSYKPLIKPKAPDKKYRLFTGTFGDKATAERMVAELKEKYGWIVYVKEE